MGSAWSSSRTAGDSESSRAQRFFFAAEPARPKKQSPAPGFDPRGGRLPWTSSMKRALDASLLELSSAAPRGGESVFATPSMTKVLSARACAHQAVLRQFSGSSRAIRRSYRHASRQHVRAGWIHRALALLAVFLRPGHLHGAATAVKNEAARCRGHAEICPGHIVARISLRNHSAQARARRALCQAPRGPRRPHLRASEAHRDRALRHRPAPPRDLPSLGARGP